MEESYDGVMDIKGYYKNSNGRRDCTFHGENYEVTNNFFEDLLNMDMTNGATRYLIKGKVYATEGEVGGLLYTVYSPTTLLSDKTFFVERVLLNLDKEYFKGFYFMPSFNMAYSEDYQKRSLDLEKYLKKRYDKLVRSNVTVNIDYMLYRDFVGEDDGFTTVND